MARVTYELKGLKRIVKSTGLTYAQVADLCGLGVTHFISILHCQCRSKYSMSLSRLTGAR